MEFHFRFYISIDAMEKAYLESNVSCPSADVSCPCIDPHDQLDSCLVTCVLQHFRSVVNKLISENQQLEE
jgi:hypothetical protein